MRVPPSNSRGLSALGISSEDEEKQQHFCRCSSPFYSAACVRPLLSVALFGCNFSIVRNLAIIAFTRFIFRNPAAALHKKYFIFHSIFYISFFCHIMIQQHSIIQKPYVTPLSHHHFLTHSFSMNCCQMVLAPTSR